jgi:hypothetical protein
MQSNFIPGAACRPSPAKRALIMRALNSLAVHAVTPLDATELHRLDRDIASLLPATLTGTRRARVFAELAEATARAKPAPDLRRAARRGSVLVGWAAAKIKRPSLRRREPRPRGLNAAPSARLQIRGAGAGRPRDVWKAVLMFDVRRALRRNGVPRGWKTHTESLLSKIFRVCASVAGHPLPGHLRGVWDNAVRIRRDRHGR